MQFALTHRAHAWLLFLAQSCGSFFSSAAKTTLVTLLEIWGELMMCLTDGFENSSISSQELLPCPIDKGVVPKLIGISHAHKHQRVENLPLYSFFYQYIVQCF